LLQVKSHHFGSHVFKKIIAVKCWSSHIGHNMRNCGIVEMSTGSRFTTLIKNLACGMLPLNFSTTSHYWTKTGLNICKGLLQQWMRISWN